LAKDELFREPFIKGVDVHRQTAAAVFGVDIAAVTSKMRDAAKTINFATVYGIGPFALSKQLGTSTAEAKQFIDQYFARFPGVRGYLDAQIAHARQHGWVETLSGRRRYIPEITATTTTCASSAPAPRPMRPCRAVRRTSSRSR
jgi:DNA polymerase-1